MLPQKFIKILYLLGFVIFTIKADANGNKANLAPIANAGLDQTIFLTQTSSVTLNGSASSGITYLWTDISTDYKSGAVIASPTSLITKVSGLIQGTWYYQLSVTTGNITVKDTVVIRVDYDLSPDGVLLSNLSQNLSLMTPCVNIRTDTLKFWSEHEQYPYFESRWYNKDSTIIYNLIRDRLNGEFIDKEYGKFYSTIEDGYPIDTYNYSRSELGLNGYIDSNKTYCFEWKGYYPQDFNYLSANGRVTCIMQINNNHGSGPPFGFTMQNKNLYFSETPRGGNGSDYTDTKIVELADLRQSHTIRLTLKEGNTSAAFIKVEVDGVQKYIRNTGKIGSTIPQDYVHFASLYDWGNSITSPANKTRGRKFSLVTESFKVFLLNVKNSIRANAGTGKSIMLPIKSTTLSGSGSTESGTISNYSWTKISGPLNYFISDSLSPITNISELTEGVYRFELKVTDNNGGTARDTVQVTVNPASNISATANAGTDKTITLPTNSVSLSGSGSDSDGNICYYSWIKISGPSAYTISNSSSAITNVSGLAEGSYQFELKVTDDKGAIGRDTVQITVNPAPNIPPTANAGAAKGITLPTNSVLLSGSGTDSDGTISSYLWTKVSGPSSHKIENAASAMTDVTELVQGIYLVELKVTDNDGAVARDTVRITVNPAANIPPAANAGGNQSIQLPVNKVILTGSQSDADGTIDSYLWTKISGPSAYNIVNPSSALTDVSELVQGIYFFELKITDNSGTITCDTMQVIVNPAANIPPVANAGDNQSIQLPINKITLRGRGSDADGKVGSYLWTRISGPAFYNIINAASPVTNVIGLVQGIYRFELQVTDNDSAVGRDTIKVTVNPANIIPITANAGPDQTIILPASTVQLSGSGTGPIVAYQWRQLSGPSTVMSTIDRATASISGLIHGVYQFELKVVDTNYVSAHDTLKVTVYPALNTLPLSWLGVQAQRINGSEVKVSWQVAQQQDVKGYTVQYSSDGNNFINACSVISSAITSYHCIIAAYKQTKNYYRVMQTDIDGKTTYSKIVLLQSSIKSALSVYPNPAQNDLYIQGMDKFSEATISDAGGKMINHFSLGANTQYIDISKLVKGIYFIKLVSVNDTQTIKFIKE